MRSGRAQVLGALSVAVVVAAGFVGCGGESAGGPTPAVQSSSSPLSSDAGGSDSGGGSDGGGEASGRTPNLPPENAALEAPDFKDYTGIKYETDQGAQETVRFFFDAMYYGYATGDISPFQRVADESACEGCAKIINDVGAWKTSGTYLTPSKNTTLSLERMQDEDSYRGRTPIYYSFERSAAVKKTVDGKSENFPQQKYEASALLAWQNDHWEVVAVSWRKKAIDE
ncbi:DUF6318 family protein [Dermabacter vaginalis]|uniref:DUF6318 domain-containing protein n=1 Tax=Dermabacter vaginalis TaxID=1630135 RepID=A0ABX6A3V1_9MICO|nr:DUF6318 family protein [Dermabacter vaginalis]QEU11886.1 hypothetical protein FOB48_05955 [Dermabacter vaginalis]